MLCSLKFGDINFYFLTFWFLGLLKFLKEDTIHIKLFFKISCISLCAGLLLTLYKKMSLWRILKNLYQKNKKISNRNIAKQEHDNSGVCSTDFLEEITIMCILGKPRNWLKENINILISLKLEIAIRHYINTRFLKDIKLTSFVTEYTEDNCWSSFLLKILKISITIINIVDYWMILLFFKTFLKLYKFVKHLNNIT